MTVRTDIRDRVIFELNASPATGIPLTTKRRHVPGRQLRGAALAAFFTAEDVLQASGSRGPIVQRPLVLTIQAAVAVEDPADADDAIEPLLAHVVAVMGGTNLNGLATNVLELGTLWESYDAGLYYHVAANRWQIQYQTQRANLSAKQ